MRNLFVAMNETAHYRNSDGNPIDVEMRRAVLPTLLTTSGKLLVVTSPYVQTDLVGTLDRRHFGRDDSPTLVIHASAPEMNGTLPADYLNRMREDDPESWRCEVMGEYRAGTSLLLDPDNLDACRADWQELPPRHGANVRFFYDASGGRNDAATLAGAHDENGRTFGDLCRAWPAPHNPEAVIAEASKIIKSYGSRAVVGDRYAGRFPQEAFLRHGIQYEVGELDRSALYLELQSRVLSQTVVIPNDPELLRELRGLERRRGFAGKDRVDHRPGAHDDRANSFAGAVSLVNTRRRGGGTATHVVFGSGAGRVTPAPCKASWSAGFCRTCKAVHAVI